MTRTQNGFADSARGRSLQWRRVSSISVRQAMVTRLCAKLATKRLMVRGPCPSISDQQVILGFVGCSMMMLASPRTKTLDGIVGAAARSPRFRHVISIKTPPATLLFALHA